MLTTSALVFLGGGFGSVSRWLVSLVSQNYFSQGWVGTLLVNILGSLLIGWVFLKFPGDSPYNTLLKVGFLGGFTTFSSFSLETALLIQNERYGEALTVVMLNVLLGVVVCIFILRNKII